MVCRDFADIIDDADRALAARFVMMNMKRVAQLPQKRQ